AGPDLERERALLEEHAASVERETAGTARGLEERCRLASVDEVDEEAMARGGGVAEPGPGAVEAERGGVDDQCRLLEDVAAREAGEGDGRDGRGAERREPRRQRFTPRRTPIGHDDASGTGTRQR